MVLIPIAAATCLWVSFALLLYSWSRLVCIRCPSFLFLSEILYVYIEMFPTGKVKRKSHIFREIKNTP